MTSPTSSTSTPPARTERLFPIRIAEPTDVAVECGIGWDLHPCDGPLDTGPQQWLHVRVTSGISLTSVRINDRATTTGGLGLRDLVPTDEHGQLLAGDYPIVVEVGRFPAVLHRELTLHVR